MNLLVRPYIPGIKPSNSPRINNLSWRACMLIRVFHYASGEGFKVKVIRTSYVGNASACLCIGVLYAEQEMGGVSLNR